VHHPYTGGGNLKVPEELWQQAIPLWHAWQSCKFAPVHLILLARAYRLQGELVDEEIPPVIEQVLQQGQWGVA
jgi:hypothetical protein